MPGLDRDRLDARVRQALGAVDVDPVCCEHCGHVAPVATGTLKALADERIGELDARTLVLADALVYGGWGIVSNGRMPLMACRECASHAELATAEAEYHLLAARIGYAGQPGSMN